MRFPRTFFRFRWKLALSGMVATAATVLGVSLVLVMVFNVRARNSFQRDDLPERVAVGFQRYTAEVRLPVVRSPSDNEAIGGWIERSSRWGKPHLRIDIDDSKDCYECDMRVAVRSLVIVDSHGRVVASTPEGPLVGTQLADAISDVGKSSFDAALSTRIEQVQLDEAGDAFVALPFLTLDGELRGLAYAELATAPRSLWSATLAFLGMLPGEIGQILMFALILGTVFSVITSRGLLRRLRRLNEASDAWRGGNFNVRVHDKSGDELGELGQALDTMADQLGTMLETRQELAALEERNHLARELHDTVKQEAFSISMLLGTVENVFRTDPDAALKHVAEARELAGRAGRELNALILQLRPASFEGKGLAGALREYCEDWSNKLGIESQVRVRGERELPLELEQTLFRVAQEALANVAWHSGAKGVEVGLAIDVDTSGDEPAHQMKLTVRDNGQGFDPNRAEKRGFGIRGMRERMAQLGGHLEISSRPGDGTLIVAECPIG